MNQNLEQFITQIVEVTELRKGLKHELRQELSVHIFEQEKELQLQGYSEEKIINILQDRFGNVQSIGKQLKAVHSLFPISLKRIGWGILVALVLLMITSWFQGLAQCGITSDCNLQLTLGPFFSLFMIGIGLAYIFLDPFCLLFYTVTLGTFGIMYFCPWLIHKIAGISERSRVLMSVVGILSLALLGNFISLSVSLKFNPVDHYQTGVPAASVGFPLRSITIPPTEEIVKQDTVKIPFTGWKNFYLNFGFWLVIATLSYSSVARILLITAQRVSLLAIIALVVMFGSLAQLLLRFSY